MLLLELKYNNTLQTQIIINLYLLFQKLKGNKIFYEKINCNMGIGD